VYIAHGWLHLSLGTPDRWFRWGILELVVTVFFLLVGLQYGGFGVAIAYSVSIYVLIGPAFWYAGKPIHLKLSSVLSSIWKYYASALAAGAICWFILNKQEISSNIYFHMNIISRIMVSASLCILLYLIFIVALYQSFSPMGQFVSVLREIIGGKFKK
jgi:PST family polysaccharide transporter